MPALANSINSLIANAEDLDRISIDGKKTIWKLTAINSIVSLINGVYFLVWSYLAYYNGVHFVQYEGFRTRPWKPEVIERNDLFYQEDDHEDVAFYFDGFRLGRWYGIVVSRSDSLWLATHERMLRKLIYNEREKENIVKCRFAFGTVYFLFVCRFLFYRWCPQFASSHGDVLW